jgi:methyl-accepting chemotaxis protein
MELAQPIAKISEESRHQQQASELVDVAIKDVGGTAQESAASIKEVSLSVQEVKANIGQVAACAQQLAQQAEKLRALGAQFKV